MKEDYLEIMGNKIKLTTFGERVELDVKKLLGMNLNDLQNEAEKLPFLLHAIGRLQARAQKNLRNFETALKYWKNKRSKEIREYHVINKIKYTETKISEDVRSEKTYEFKNRVVADAEEKYEIIKSIYWSLQAKVNLLVELNRQDKNFNYQNNK